MAKPAEKEPKKARAKKETAAVKKRVTAKAKAEPKTAKVAPEKKTAPKLKIEEGKKEPQKKEVKVFAKEEVKRPVPARQVFRKGKRYQVKEVRRKSQAPQPTRPLLKTEITVGLWQPSTSS
jgi:hypothetical protein